jgi:hypothetical protein
VAHVLVRHRMLIFVAKILWSTTHAPQNAYMGAPQKRFSLLVRQLEEAFETRSPCGRSSDYGLSLADLIAPSSVIDLRLGFGPSRQRT